MSEEIARTAQQGANSPAAAKELYPMSNWKYDTFLWTMAVLVELFFREVHPRGAWKVPRHGPVLFVAAPHANQFVDALVLQRTLKNEAKRRVSLLIAQKSVHGFIGWASRQVGSVPVGRAQDSAKPAKGTIYLPDPIRDPTLIRGIGTDFQKQAEVGGMVFLPSVKGQSGSSLDVAQIIGPEEMRIKRPVTAKLALTQLTGRDDIDEAGKFMNADVEGPKPGYEGTKFKLAPHIDQSKVYQAVFDRLKSGGCVGIFPEGGSHDRTELLPLKAGVAIMALGTLAEAPDCGLKIVPVGMNYFHAHKFRSRAVVEFGPPFEVPPKLVHMYKNNQRRDAIGQLLDMVHSSLSAVTVSAPDYDTLMVIQAARRLYNPTGKKLPLPVVVELNRRLALGYERYKADERIVKLKDSVTEYNKQLRYLNIRDHQVEYAKTSWPRVVGMFVVRLSKLLLLAAGVLPGLILFAPVFIATKYISRQKAKTALAGSSVKIQGRDVMATWKLLVAMAFAPVLYNLYTSILAYLVYKDRLGGRVPDWVPIWAVFLAGWVVFPTITFAALRFGEVGMDIFKSLRPLALCINPASSYNIVQLRERRAELSAQVTHLINTLGPEMFPDFEHTRLVFDPGYPRGAAWSPTAEHHPNPFHDGPTSPVTPGGGRPSSSHSTSAQQQQQQSAKHQRTRSGASSPGTPATTTSTNSGAATGASSPPLVRRSHTTQSSRAIPRNESFSNIGQAPLFATRPPSRNRSRSSSAGGGGGGPGGGGFGGFGGFGAGFTPAVHTHAHSHQYQHGHNHNHPMAGFPVAGFTTLDSKEGFDQANRKIREAMRERGELRRRRSEQRRRSWIEADGEGDGAGSSDEEEGVEEGHEEGEAGSLQGGGSSVGGSVTGDYEEARKRV